MFDRLGLYIYAVDDFSLAHYSLIASYNITRSFSTLFLFTIYFVLGLLAVSQQHKQLAAKWVTFTKPRYSLFSCICSWEWCCCLHYYIICDCDLVQCMHISVYRNNSIKRIMNNLYGNFHEILFQLWNLCRLPPRAFSKKVIYIHI